MGKASLARKPRSDNVHGYDRSILEINGWTRLSDVERLGTKIRRKRMFGYPLFRSLEDRVEIDPERFGVDPQRTIGFKRFTIRRRC